MNSNPNFIELRVLRVAAAVLAILFLVLVAYDLGVAFALEVCRGRS